MKIFIQISLVFMALGGYSQTPEKVYSIAKEQRELAWYQTQEKLWENELGQHKKSPRAWRNYYESIRAQWILNGRGENSEREYQSELNTIVEDCYEAIPNSFEANFLMYRHFSDLTNGEAYFPYLEKAYAIDSLNAEAYDLFITYYEVKRNIKGREKFARKAFEANLFAHGVMNWAYNVLMEVEEGGILFTAGDNDTYPFWVLQAALGVRKDVTVLNTSLLTIDAYRKKVLREKGIQPIESELQSAKSYEQMDSLKCVSNANIFENDQGIPVHVSGTAVFQFQEKFGDNLYLTGLTYRYSTDEIDNLPIIRKNFEKRFLLDYLTTSFSFHIQNNLLPRLNATYLPGMVKLYKHYKAAGDYQRMKKMENFLVDISKKVDQYDTIQLLIEGK